MDNAWIQVAALLLFLAGVGTMAYAAVRLLARNGVSISEEGATRRMPPRAD